MSATPLSMTAQAAFHDLLTLLQDERASDLRGSPKRKIVNGRGYWFDQYRVGDRVVERYLGADTPDLSGRLERSRELIAGRKAMEAERARLARLLRAEGLLSPDGATGRLLAAMAKAGAFRLGSVVVGTHAFRHYEGVLGIRFGLDRAAVTQDIDIAAFERLSVTLAEAGAQTEGDLNDVFRDLDFEPVPGVARESVWRWRQVERAQLVEFLTPAFGEEGVTRLPALGVGARALHYLNYLVRDPIPVPSLYRAGVLITVPRPERYAIHKLIVADRRRAGSDSAKSRKDRAQAELLIRHFAEEDPHLLISAFEEARLEGPRWIARIDASLARLPDTSAALAAARRAVG